MDTDLERNDSRTSVSMQTHNFKSIDGYAILMSSLRHEIEDIRKSTSTSPQTTLPSLREIIPFFFESLPHQPLMVNNNQSQENIETFNQPTRICNKCRTSSTPRWRSGPKGKKTLCNSCGLKYVRDEKKRKYEVPKCYKHPETFE